MKRYTDRPKTAYEHAWEIRAAYGFRAFEDALVGEEFRRFLDGRAWTHAEGPAALFEQAVGWLRRHRVLLPGITVLTRLVNTVRDAAADRLHARLAAAVEELDPMLPVGCARRCGCPTVPGFRSWSSGVAPRRGCPGRV